MTKHSPSWIVVGAGGFAREVAWQIESHDANGGILMAVEPQFLPGDPTVGMYDVATIDDALSRTDGYSVWILGVGQPTVRRRIAKCVEEDQRFTAWSVLTSANAICAHSATFAPGAYVGPGCVVSVGATVGRHALVNQCCSIGHDVTIGEHAIVCPGCVLSGGVVIGDGAFLGSGVVVYPRVTIGTAASVPAGTVVKRNVPPGAICWGS